MTAEHYLHVKESLSQTMNGQDRLMEAVKDIREVLTKHGIDSMPETAFDVMCFTLETIHLDGLNLSRFMPAGLKTGNGVPLLQRMPADRADKEQKQKALNAWREANQNLLNCQSEMYFASLNLLCVYGID